MICNDEVFVFLPVHLRVLTIFAVKKNVKIISKAYYFTFAINTVIIYVQRCLLSFIIVFSFFHLSNRSLVFMIVINSSDGFWTVHIMPLSRRIVYFVWKTIFSRRSSSRVWMETIVGMYHHHKMYLQRVSYQNRSRKGNYTYSDFFIPFRLVFVHFLIYAE